MVTIVTMVTKVTMATMIISREHGKKFTGCFTLLEVVVAIAVLAMGLVIFMGLAASTSKRMNRAFYRWEHQHVLAQAAEYFLLTNKTEQPPEDIFPYDEYTVDIELGKPDNLPEGVEDTLDKWKLVKVSLVLRNNDGDELESLKMDKIVYETDKDK